MFARGSGLAEALAQRVGACEPLRHQRGLVGRGFLDGATKCGVVSLKDLGMWGVGGGLS